MPGVQNRGSKSLRPLVRLDDTTLADAAAKTAKYIRQTTNARGESVYVVIHRRAIYVMHTDCARAEGLWSRRDVQRVGCYAITAQAEMLLSRARGLKPDGSSGN